MKHDQTKRMIRKLNELENSLLLAKRALSLQNPIPLSELKRITDYVVALRRQKKLVRELHLQIEAKNWEPVSRLSRLIHGITTLVHEDAELLTSRILEVPSQRAAV